MEEGEKASLASADWPLICLRVDLEDRVEEAPGLQRTSRLACQCKITGSGPIRVRVPAWNRNAVKEVPH